MLLLGDVGQLCPFKQKQLRVPARKLDCALLQTDTSAPQHLESCRKK